MLRHSHHVHQRRPFAACLAFVCVLLLAACNQQPITPAAVSQHDSPNDAGIQWLRDDVNGAFVMARAQHKPVLLYWGAIWCPPCQQLKATVFSRPDFIAKTRQFVSVYLDGDQPSAQKWGDQFQVSGYPTVVILDGDRHEVMRLAGGMDLSQYASVLDIVLADLVPIDRLLSETGDAEPLSATTCNRLAFNAWTLDDLNEAEFSIRATRLAALSQRCTQVASLAAARLAVFAAYFRAAVEAKALEKGTALSPAMHADIDRVQVALNTYGSDAKLTDALQTLDENFFKTVKATNPATRQSLRTSYLTAMDAEAMDSNLAEADHISALGRKLMASRVLSLDGQWPQQDVADARTRIDSVLSQRQTPYVRSSILNSVLNVYDELKWYQQSYDLVQTELPTAAHPYYLKGDLAEIAEQLGHKDEAVKLRAEAYKESEGTATRFQWGQRYVSALMRLRPQDAQQIAAATAQVLTELDGPDRIYRRARLGLQHLDEDLRAWNKAARGGHVEVLRSLRQQMQTHCAKIPSNEPARASCDRFLMSA